MVNVGTLSLGVNLKGARQAKRQAERVNDSVERLENTSDSASTNLNGLENSMRGTRNESEGNVGILQRLVTWLGLAGSSALGLSGTFATLKGSLTTVVALGGKLLAGLGSLAGVAKLVAGGIGVLVKALGSTAIIIGSLIVGAGLLITEILGITDVTRISMDSLRSFAGTVFELLTSGVDRLRGAVGSGTEFITGLIDGARNRVDGLINRVDDLISRIASIPDVDVSLPGIDTVTGAGETAMGGFTSGVDAVTGGVGDFIPDFGGGDDSNGGGVMESITDVMIDRVTVTFDGDVDLSDLSRREQRKIAEDLADTMGEEISKNLP